MFESKYEIEVTQKYCGNENAEEDCDGKSWGRNQSSEKEDGHTEFLLLLPHILQQVKSLFSRVAHSEDAESLRRFSAPNLVHCYWIDDGECGRVQVPVEQTFVAIYRCCWSVGSSRRSTLSVRTFWPPFFGWWASMLTNWWLNILRIKVPRN